MLASINPARMDPFRPSKVLPKRRRRLENAPAIEHADGYQRMRVCIFGAGAVGSHFAVRLALAGHEVSCVMRGPHLDAAKTGGLTLRAGDVEFSADVRASEDPAALGPQDVVISTLKATGLQNLVAGLPPLLHEDTAVVFAQNGIPWWYDLGLSSAPPPPNLSFLDPGGRLRATVPEKQIIGGVIFSANEVIAPGVVRNLSPERNMLLVGECDDRPTERIERLRTMLGQASIASPRVARIREAIWSKLLTNMSMSVLCLLTGQTARAVRDDPDLREAVSCLLDEAHAVAQSCCPEVKRVTRSGPAPDHKPSILQDYELGRSMEINVLVRAPAAFARAAGLATPMLDLMGALAIQKARDKGLYTR
jgi:2-dehydropantoate 2-reductase